jgi:hypothetical protein
VQRPCPWQADITRTIALEQTRIGVKKRIGLRASELREVRGHEPLLKHVLPLFIGFGSDFDGGITVSYKLSDVAGLSRLIATLRKHGYDEAALRKLTHENWLRVLGKAWRD